MYNKADEELTVKLGLCSNASETAAGKEPKDYAADPREALTISYEDYERQNRNKGQTVRLSDAQLDNTDFDPVGIVITERKQQNQPNLQELSSKPQPSDCLYPVGWLVCIEGNDVGRAFPLKEGRNAIGRSLDMDVVIKHDPAVSRKNHVWIEYSENNRCFQAIPGEARKLVYVNDDLLFTPTRMKKNDMLTLGDSTLMLIPCCDDHFTWKGISGNSDNGSILS